MTNEHHATATCANSVCTIPMAILARETKKVRLLALGMPIGNRNDPIRVAEEYSMLDVISRGRIEMGFVKGVPFEISPANTNPADLMERFWEAHDLILKAMTSHDGPFNWEGTHFHYRSVNVWPRPWQQPHPPVWMPVGSTGSAMEAAERGMTIGVLNTGWVRTPGDLRGLSPKGGRGRPPDDARQRLAYMALIGVGDTREEGWRRADQILGYSRTSGIVAPQFMNPPGYASPAQSAQSLKMSGAEVPRRPHPVARRPQHRSAHDDGRGRDRRRPRLRRHAGRRLRPAARLLRPCRRLRAPVDDGPGRLVDHDETVANLTMFSKEVLPRLSELG